MLQLRRDGDFPFLLWKDTAPQHFESTYGEYPQVSREPLLHSSMALGCPYGWSSKCPCDFGVLSRGISFKSGPSALSTLLWNCSSKQMLSGICLVRGAG